MSTYNKTTGTGGLDASILFEKEREENDVLGIEDTTGVLDVHFGSYRSSQLPSTSNPSLSCSTRLTVILAWADADLIALAYVPSVSLPPSSLSHALPWSQCCYGGQVL